MVSLSSSWVIDSGATNHITSIRSKFRSYRPVVQGNIRVAYLNYIQVMGEGSTNVSLNISLFSVLYVSQSAHNLVLVHQPEILITTLHSIHHIVFPQT